MKVKVSEASGVVLDWLVAKCEGHRLELNYQYTEGRRFDGWWQCGPGHWQPLCRYWADWAQGGPIIDREKISIIFHVSNGVAARTTAYPPEYHYGPTPLIAAMRCLVTSRLGEEVEVPDELLKT